MAKELHRKLDIAYDYLSVAVELYYQGHYFSALGLAGMAEEIFEAVMEARNEHPAPARSGALVRLRDDYVPMSRQLIALARALSPNLRKLKDRDIYAKLYRAKNSAKHGTVRGGREVGFDLTIEADAELEAYNMLARAIENCTRLHYEPVGLLLKFYREYLAGRKTAHHEGSTLEPGRTK